MNLASHHVCSGIVGRSSAIARVRHLVAQVAPLRATVLLTGPSGSGKEVVARATHSASDRASRPFVAVNCGAIPRDLLETQLFGHEKGAFTGAHAQHRGFFEEADGGTLFLDEIGDMPADMQVKLLRVLEQGCVQRVGGRGAIAVDVRVIAATHRDLETAVEQGRFREDLYYRLAVFPIELPALAERLDDLPGLVDHFVGASGSRAAPILSPQAYERMAEHGWPGNVRELRNFVERASILYAGRVVGADEAGALLLRRGRIAAREQAALWATAAGPEPIEPAVAKVVPIRASDPTLADIDLRADSPVPLREILSEIERRYIEQAMARSDGVVADAARLLSLQRTTLVEKLRRHEARSPPYNY